MIDSVLIANRGAIATRIIRSLKAMGVRALAVYAEADRDSLHVQRADEAYCLGDGSAATTYLDQDKLFDIAKRARARAIHPGYGFLSENPDFVRRCEREGIVFLGPTAEQIEAFGLTHWPTTFRWGPAPACSTASTRPWSRPDPLLTRSC